MSSPALQIQDVTDSWQRMGGLRRDATLVCGAVLLVSALIFAWIYLTRKQRARHSRHHSHRKPHEFGKNPGASTQEDPADGKPRRRRHRRRRRDHRPRNPTLAETGGLPPIRPESERNTLP